MFFDSAIYPSDDFRLEDNGDSELQNYFSGTTVFVTGGTGFLGKLLVEKLLRTCRGVKKIYLLIRQKKKDDPYKRLEKLFEECVFDKVRNRECLNKVSVLAGDLAQKDLGLDQEDLEILRNEVTYVFHVGATVRFNDHLREAAFINVRSTWDLLELAREMRNLRSFVYFSTAFSFCVRKVIDEVKYRSKVKAEHLITLVEALDEDELDKITPVVLGNWPNTYTFTKSIAEDLIIRQYSDLPLGILRPSIVMSTAKEPLAGWTDSFGGLTGLVVGREMGVIHTAKAQLKRTVEIVPADYVVNCSLAVAWDIGTKRAPLRPSIYNYISSTQAPVNIYDSQKWVRRVWEKIPPVQVLCYPFLIVTRDPHVYAILNYILHILFSYVYDCVNFFLGKPAFAIQRYKKLEEQLEHLAYFTVNECTWSNFNTQRLWNDLSLKDQQLFNFDMGTHNWEDYSVPYTVGLRVYLLKDPLDTAPEGRKRWYRLKILHYAIMSVIVALTLLFLYLIFTKIR